MKFTFEFTWPCSKCKQPLTDLDLSQANYSLTILPTFILSHQTCPKSQTKNECHFNFLKDQ